MKLVQGLGLWHGIVELGLTRPAAQAVHVVADAAVSVSVSDPAGHGWHAVVELGLNWPGAQAVHDVADPSVSVSVMDPALHGWHGVIESGE